MSQQSSAEAADTNTGPCCVFFVGRGGTGKSLLCRWIAERAFAAGRTLVIADGDRTSRSLHKYFDGVLFPETTDAFTTGSWLETTLDRAITDRVSLIVNLGGGDQVIERLANEVPLQEVLEENGVTPILLHLIGPELDSLGPLSILESPHFTGSAAPLFAPQRTALILNAGLIPDTGADPATVFTLIREQRVFQDALKRGARSIAMPRLWSALEVSHRELSFAQAATGQTGKGLTPLSFGDQQRVKLWLHAMEQDFASITEWLP